MNDLNFTLKVPDNTCKVMQGEEQFIVTCDDGKKIKIRSHDYDSIYKIPGLYEHLFYEKYKCNSPSVICSELKAAVEDSTQKMSDIKVLDVGAGNGMVGEELIDAGVDTVVGIDIIEEAAMALERDRPGIYSEYFVEDLTKLPSNVEKKITRESLNCMTVVAALGFGDIPPEAFAEGYNLIAESGWVAFNIKDEFCSKCDQTGFARLIGNMTENGVMEVKSRKHYVHRLCQDGTPLEYYAIVAKKQEDIPGDMLCN